MIESGAFGRLPELAGETREVVHPILRHQDHAMYFRQVRDAYAIGNYRHEPRLAEPEVGLADRSKSLGHVGS